jgi:ABC-2 type transport system ATP-binding protein
MPTPETSPDAEKFPPRSTAPPEQNGRPHGIIASPMLETPDAIRTEGLRKDFGSRRAVDGLDLAIRRGEIFGLLGPNGAGKSTTIRMLLGLISPTDGRSFIAGHCMQSDRTRALRDVGAIVEAPCFYEHLTARKNLEFAQHLHGVFDPQRLQEALGLVRLTDRQDDAVETFSHGMRQRLGIARALLHRPAVVILDEPSDGLDPRGRREVRDIVLDISRQLSITVLISSHLLNEMEMLCDRVAIMNLGKLLFAGAVDELRAGERRSARVVVDRPDRARDLLLGLSGVANVTPDGEALTVGLSDGVADAATLARALVEGGIAVRELSTSPESLEDMFLRLTESSTC